MEALSSFKRLHLVGIGGIGVSAVASILLRRGFEVSGSDSVESEITRRLERSGARVFIGHRAENVNGAEVIIVSNAIPDENPELTEARAKGLPIWPRARALAEIMRGGKGLAISGTHGKTTTTCMMGLALEEAGFDPTVLVGGDMEAFEGNARTGGGDWIVAEADESDASFLQLDPDRIILTNIEADHLDFYRDLDHIVETFGEFLGRLRLGGKLIACLDSPALARLLQRADVPTLTYSLDNPDADLVAADVRRLNQGATIRFTPVFHGERLGSVRLGVPGTHNVSNALAVVLMGIELGCDFDSISRGLGRYGGVKRRFEIKGIARGVTVVDDYAHHPTEIEVTLAVARDQLRRGRRGRVVALFQPHRYTRTQRMAPEFGKSFRDADTVVVTGIYGAGEEPIEGVSGSDIFDRIVADGHPDAHYLSDQGDVIDFLKSRLGRGDMLLTLGAGDVWMLGERILNELNSNDANASTSEYRPAIASA